jgi:hypothetical protein
VSGDGEYDEGEKEKAIDRAVSVEWFKLRAVQLRFDAVKRGEAFEPKPASPRPNLKAIAELWRITVKLGRPVPRWAQLFICDLLDPPEGSLNDWCLITKERAPKKKTLRAWATAQQIDYEIESGLSQNKAIDKVLGPERRSEGRAILKLIRQGGVKIGN